MIAESNPAERDVIGGIRDVYQSKAEPVYRFKIK